MTLILDHLAVAAETLEAGTAHVETLLGVALSPGGAHPEMGTHNRLLSLGPDLYLEVIAVDPGAAPPGRARWFGLDGFSGPPRLAGWVVRTGDLEGSLAAAPAGLGRPMALSRGDLRWRMAVPGDGRLPYDGAAPALITWDGPAHPCARLPDRHCHLAGLVVEHPRIAELLAEWPMLARVTGATLREGPEPRLRARIDTPAGRVTLG